MSSETELLLKGLIILVLMGAGVFFLILSILTHGDIKRMREDTSAQAVTYPPDAFLSGKVKRKDLRYPGVFVIFNETKGQFYPLQTDDGDIIQKIKDHFTGKGCPAVYLHYQKGDVFQVKFIPLSGSAYQTLPALLHYIQTSYSSFAVQYTDRHMDKPSCR